ncbi:MAG TPA: DUF2334 domain-containing protein, partial [Urbifossiella sp.]|nr:DUF2334 domain-containing protein [Urbifossiella sp.]
PTVVLRVDDVGRGDPATDALLGLLREAGVAASVQVVPGWLTPRTAARLRWWCDRLDGRVEVGQHGWQHANHAPAGERQYEFGPARGRAEQLADVRAGRDRLRELLPGQPVDVFTPPHDRLDRDTLEVLAAEGFRIVSGGTRTFDGCPSAGPAERFVCEIDAGERVDGVRRLRAPAAVVSEVRGRAGVVGVVLHAAEARDPTALAALVDALARLREEGARFTTMSRARGVR